MGIGRFNVVRQGIHVDTGEKIALRSGLKSHVSARELKFNSIFSEIDSEGEFFVSGVPVHHTGSWSSRTEEDGIQYKNMDKITLVMAMISGGELFDRLDDFYGEPPEGFLAENERISIALHLTQGLNLAHRNSIVDLDYKVENIFLEGSVPKMGDFGGMFFEGQLIDHLVGSPGSLSPEIVRFIFDGEPFPVTSSNQMWLHGCVLAKLFRGWEFDACTDQDETISENVLDREFLERAMNRIFPDNKIVGTIDWCIAQCLQYDQEDRITAEELIPYFEELLNNPSNDCRSDIQSIDLSDIQSIALKVTRYE